MSSVARSCLTAATVACIAIVIAVSPVHGGKLSRLRDKTDEKPARQREESRTSSAKKSASAQAKPKSSGSRRRPRTRPAAASSRATRSASPNARIASRQAPHVATDREGKLGRVSSQVRSQSTAPRPVRSNGRRSTGDSFAHRRGHRHGHFRPGRSAFGMGLQFGPGWYSAPAAPTSYTVIEEHYYSEPAVYRAQSVEPLVVEDNYVIAEPVSPSDYYPTERSPYVEPAVVSHEYVAPVMETPVERMLKPWNVRLGIEYAGDTDDELSQFGFEFLANATAGFGVDADIRMLREHGVGFRDHLWLGDANIVYELFPTEYVRPRVGIGVNWLADSYGSEAGLNLTVGADIQLLSRLALTGEIDFGTLGDSDFFHANTTVGLQQSETVEWYAGYDYIDIGGVRIESIVGGIRFRF